MRNIYIIMLFTALTACGTKYGYIDSGICNGKFEGSMMDYLRSKPQHWDSIVKIIERAGMEPIFEKEDITFLGPSNITIKKWFYWDDKNGGYEGNEQYTPHGYKQISDVPEALCRKIVLRHIVDGKRMRNDIPRVTFDEKGNKNGGGEILSTRAGNKLWIWSIQKPYMNIPEMGPVLLDLASLSNNGESNRSIGIASADIEPYNGVVHSLPDKYSLIDMGELLNPKE
ncbi:MAG: hypothetical protein ACRDDZ_00850 [Marinifilaceae bacterium]